MARLRGRGYASVNYPTGMNLGGDPSQALIHATTTGTFVITLSSVDLGQGIKTIAAQCAAETLGLPIENVLVNTADTDTGPHCMGTFASRGTHRVGNAVIMAAAEARAVMLEVAAEELEVDAGDLETDGTGVIKLKGSDQPSIHITDLALAAHFKHGRTISGRGIFLKEPSVPVPETGEMDPDSCQAHACTVAVVEVDDETGVVEVLELYNAYEIGRALNPAMATQQVEGGAWMGMSHALFETTEPYYPRRDHGPRDFADYLMPGPADIPVQHSLFLERPAGNGPYGAKGIGEMTANAPIPAIANAIFDACGVRVTAMPFTPERVLRGLDALARDAPREVSSRGNA
ncbi:xanthine dehydrogenase family protein molybdopterin-binding subunit [Streptosporangium sp. G12]